jgi:uncharacterized repeat protein (TIGR03803 family)
MKKSFSQSLIAAACLVLVPGAANAATETVLANLGPSGNNSTGSFPYGSLILDGKGNLYGTAANGGKYNGGVVFKLSPPTAINPAWSETILFSFNGTTTGGYPAAALATDTAGNLYGTAKYGGAHFSGVVFKLTPSRSGTWTESTIFAFNGASQGGYPNAALVVDSKGNLYGTTPQGGKLSDGAVFELSPPAAGHTAWTETVLQSFTGKDGESPVGKLTFDQTGNLYGTASGGGAASSFTQQFGVVFKLAKPAAGKTAWTESVLLNFNGAGGNGANPTGAVTFDGTGNLYGTAQWGGGGLSVSQGPGTVFKLAPPRTANGSWTPSILLSFSQAYGLNPNGDIVLDTAGNLYTTTAGGGKYNDGTVIKLAARTWAPTVLVNFNGANGQAPTAGLIFDPKVTTLYGTTPLGGKKGYGTVFRLTQ